VNRPLSELVSRVGDFDILPIRLILPRGSELCGSRLMPWAGNLLPHFLFNSW
jgi:hypothetical protein